LGNLRDGFEKYLRLKESLPNMYLLKSGKLNNRIDFYHYNPKIDQLENLLIGIQSSKKINDLEKENLVNLSNETIDPSISPDEEFSYISIASIDVLEHQGSLIDYFEIMGGDAPSRARQLVREGDLLISMVRPTRGAVFLATREQEGFICSTGFAVLKIHPSINRVYLSELFQTSYILDQMEKLQAGTEYPAINKNDIKSLILPIPERFKQDYIVNRLRQVREKRVDLLKKANDLERVSQEEFEATRNSPFEELINGKKENTLLDDKLYVIKSSKLKDRLDYEWYRKIHKELKQRFRSTPSIRKIKDIREKLSYGLSINADYFESGVQFLRIDNISNEKLDLDDVKFVSEEIGSRLSSSYLNEGDILISRSGTIGVAVSIPNGVGRLTFGSYMLRLVLKNLNEVDPEYVSNFLNSSFGKLQFHRITTGSSQLNITIPGVEAIEMPIPEKSIQDAVVNKINRARVELAMKTEDVKRLRKEAEKMLQDEQYNVLFEQ
jgi:restriction endonuclease S subunit